MVADDRLHSKQQKLVQAVGEMSILMEISVLLALLLVKTRASGTRNGLFEANLDTACTTLSALPVYLPYRNKYRAGIKQKTSTSKKRRISAASSSSARCSKNIEAEGTPDLSGANGQHAPERGCQRS